MNLYIFHLYTMEMNLSPVFYLVDLWLVDVFIVYPIIALICMQFFSMPEIFVPDDEYV